MRPMRQKRLLVDMDGVMADPLAQYLRMHEREHGRRLDVASIVGKPEMEAFPDAVRFVTTPGFFRGLPVMEGCVEVVAQLNARYELFVVSAAMEYPTSLAEKHAWLEEHFSFLGWRQFVFCGSKTVVRGDIMIDDHFKNLDYFEGRTLLFTQPHNQLSDAGRHERVASWADVARLLL